MKNIFISFFALILLFSLTGCGGNKTNDGSDNMMSDIQNGMHSAEDKVESGVDKAEDKMDGMMDSMKAKISREEVKKIALDHAKLKEEDIKNYHIELNKDDGVLEYDIEFDHQGTEYDYEINADTGEIREHSKNKED